MGDLPETSRLSEQGLLRRHGCALVLQQLLLTEVLFLLCLLGLCLCYLLLLLLLLGGPFSLLPQVLCLHRNMSATISQSRTHKNCIGHTIPNAERTVARNGVKADLTYLHRLLLRLCIIWVTIGVLRLELRVLRLNLCELRLYSVLRLNLGVLDLQGDRGVDLDVGQVY